MPARYMKDELGFVHVEGMITGGVATTGTKIAQMPVGYMPSGNIFGPGSAFNGTSVTGDASITITAAGEVLLNENAASNWLKFYAHYKAV